MKAKFLIFIRNDKCYNVTMLQCYIFRQKNGSAELTTEPEKRYPEKIFLPRFNRPLLPETGRSHRNR